jgi:hypothetical protein
LDVIKGQRYRNALVQDFDRLPADPLLEDAMFSRQGIPNLLAESPAHQVEAWEHLLNSLKTNDEKRYQTIHKGTPYYFLGCAAFLCRDFEKALFYMDCALEEDRKLANTKPEDRPAGRWLLLDTDSHEHHARPLVIRIRMAFEQTLADIAALGGSRITLEEFRKNVVARAIGGNAELRGAVTAFFSFLLEHEVRMAELSLSPVTGGSGEPFYLHLLKGAVLFETLLKTSVDGKRVLAVKKGKATLDDFIKDRAIYQRLGFATPLQGLGGRTFDDVLIKIASDTSSFNSMSVRGTWAIRNTTGHSLSWPRRLTPPQYKQVFQLVVGALTLVISKLHA